MKLSILSLLLLTAVLPFPVSRAEEKRLEKQAIPTASVTAEKGKNALRETLAGLIASFKPLYTLAGTSIQEIRDPALTPETIYAVRIVFSGNPLEKIIPAEKHSRKTVPEFADILLIPANTPFRVDKALTLERKTAGGQNGDALFTSRFGLAWRKLPGRLRSFIVYAGKNRDFHVFASSNLPFLLRLRKVMDLKNGFSPAEYLANALSVRDEYDITAETASRMLPSCGDEALPFLAAGISRMIAIDDIPYPHFRVLAQIKTPAAYKMMNEYAASSDRKILLALYDALFSLKQITPELKECYLSMLSHQIAVPFAIDACDKIHAREEGAVILQKILREPDSYSVYSQAFLSDYEWRHPGAKSIHAKAESQIRLLLIRSGEVPGSVQYIDINENSADQTLRLNKEDRERIEPFFNSLRNAPERDLTVLVGMNLALTEIPVRGVSPKYIHRLRSTGIRLLKSEEDLQARARILLRKLLTNGKPGKEYDLLQETAELLN